MSPEHRNDFFTADDREEIARMVAVLNPPPLAIVVLDSPTMTDEEYERLKESWDALSVADRRTRVAYQTEPTVIRVMTTDDYLKRLLVDLEPPGDWLTGERVKEAAQPKGAFEAPCEWCSSQWARLNPDGTCPICGYDW